MMTQKQRDLLEFIKKRMDENGVPPSFDEMRVALDLRSKSGIHRLITALEERGYIRRLAHRARAIEIIRDPDAGVGGVLTELEPRHPVMAEIPIMGKIAAGVPIEAIQNAQGETAVPLDMVGTGTHFALEVNGESMIEAGIHDGDMVIIREQKEAKNGEIVVALVEGQEATLKRLRRKGNAIALEAANPAFETRVYRADQVQIQGKLVGLMRNY